MLDSLLRVCVCVKCRPYENNILSIGIRMAVFHCPRLRAAVMFAFCKVFCEMLITMAMYIITEGSLIRIETREYLRFCGFCFVFLRRIYFEL